MLLFGIIQIAWLMSRIEILTDAAYIGANTLAVERGTSSPYCNTVGAPMYKEGIGGTNVCQSCAINAITSGQPNCLNQIFPALKTFSGNTMNSTNTKIAMMTVGGITCSADAICNGFGASGVPPAAGTVAAVQLKYTFTPLVPMPTGNILSSLICGGNGNNNSTCTLYSPIAYAIVQ